jgi:hypothetical protein
MPPSTSLRVRKHRESLRQAGMRPIQLWVPDTRRPGFAEECRRQSALIVNDPNDREITEAFQQIVGTDGWE